MRRSGRSECRGYSNLRSGRLKTITRESWRINSSDSRWGMCGVAWEPSLGSKRLVIWGWMAVWTGPMNWTSFLIGLILRPFSQKTLLLATQQQLPLYLSLLLLTDPLSAPLHLNSHPPIPPLPPALHHVLHNLRTSPLPQLSPLQCSAHLSWWEVSWSDFTPAKLQVPKVFFRGCLKSVTPSCVEYLVKYSTWTCTSSVLWKTSCLVPVRKTPCPSGPQDYRLVAVTFHIMKTVERLVLEQLRPMVRPFTDPLQFTYQPRLGV